MGWHGMTKESESPWGFDNFSRGSVGIALLDWAVNGWNEMYPDDGKTMEEFVLIDFESLTKNSEFSVFLRDAWFRDYQALMINQFNYLLWRQNERDIKAWLGKQFALFREVAVAS